MGLGRWLYLSAPLGMRRWLDGRRAKSQPVTRGQLPDKQHIERNKQLGLDRPRDGFTDTMTPDEDFSLRVIRKEDQ